MKKDLFLMRHATAESAGSSAVMRDYERELTSKGIMEAAKAGKFLKDYFDKVDIIYASGALRTRQTAQYLSEQIKLDEDKVICTDTLYGNGPRGYLEILNHIPEEINCVIVIGHNPDISYFAEYLTHHSDIGDFHKATLVHIEFTDLDWAEISQGTGHFITRNDI